MDAFGDAVTCPNTPLDVPDFFENGGSWTETCETYKNTAAGTSTNTKHDDDYYNEYYQDYSTNEIQTVKNTNQKPKEEEAFKLKNVLGAGIDRGLSVIVDTLECGWHSTSLFDGVKVYLKYLLNMLLNN